MTLSFAEGPRAAPAAPSAGATATPTTRRCAIGCATLIAAERGALAFAATRVLAIGGTAPGFYGLELPPPAGARPSSSGRSPTCSPASRPSTTRPPSAHAEAWRAEEPLDAPWEHLVAPPASTWRSGAMARDEGANALAVRCWPELPDACGAMACAAMGRAADRRTPAACEGDVWGAASMRVLQAVADAPAGAARPLRPRPRARRAAAVALRQRPAGAGRRARHAAHDPLQPRRPRGGARPDARARSGHRLPAAARRGRRRAAVVIGGRVLEARAVVRRRARLVGRADLGRERVSAERAVAASSTTASPTTWRWRRRRAHRAAGARRAARRAPLAPSPREGLGT
jgi:hypothetical protein